MFYINTLDFCKFQENPRVLSVDIRESSVINRNKEQIENHNKAFFGFLSRNTVLNELYFYFNIECCYTGDCCEDHFNTNAYLFANIQFPPNLSILSLCRIDCDCIHDRPIIHLPAKLKIIILYDFNSFVDIDYNDDIEQIILADCIDVYFLENINEYICSFSRLYKLKSIKFYNCSNKKTASSLEKYIKQMKLPYGCITEIHKSHHPIYKKNILHTRNMP